MKFFQVLAAISAAVLFVADAKEYVDIGQSFYLPDKDIYNPRLGGVHIFKPFHDSCYKWHEQKVTIDDRSTFEDTNSFYNKISSDSSLDAKLTGKYTMGTTLNVKTTSWSTGTVKIKGASVNVAIYVNATYLNQDCFKSLKSELADDVIKVFDSLPLDITKPWLKGSWQLYQNFLKTFGSHFVVKTYLGAIVRQWTFSKTTSSYSDEQMKIRACVDFAGPAGIGKLNLSACSGVTKEEAESVSHLETSSYMAARGGSDETRNRFRSSRSQEDLDRLLNEGREMQTPVSYEYISIWDILVMKFYNNRTRLAKVNNLMHYYYGFEDFGCSYLSEGDRELRKFDYNSDSTPQLPRFSCTLINEGCHVDDDCHIGGAKTVTYCYGASCYEYKDPAFGFKAKSVVARTKSSGSYKEGLNKSCHYKAAFKARCITDYFQKTVIWNGEGVAQLASKIRAVYASQQNRH